jgi:hypothetical protein
MQMLQNLNLKHKYVANKLASLLDNLCTLSNFSNIVSVAELIWTYSYAECNTGFLPPSPHYICLCPFPLLPPGFPSGARSVMGLVDCQSWSIHLCETGHSSGWIVYCLWCHYTKYCRVNFQIIGINQNTHVAARHALLQVGMEWSYCR